MTFKAKQAKKTARNQPDEFFILTNCLFFVKFLNYLKKRVNIFP